MNKPAATDNCTESLIAQAADEFLARLQAGESPAVQTYIERYPHLAAVLPQILESLRVLEHIDCDELEGDSAAGEIQPLVSERCLGDFRLIREVGRGGMGVVYEAEQVSLGRRVALKVLPFAALLDERQLGRFKNEARAAGALHHTNIVPVHFVGCERGVHFYAMQYIDGQTLAQVIVALRAQDRMREHRQSNVATNVEPESAVSPLPRDLPDESQPHLPTADTLRADCLTTILSEQRRSPAIHFHTIARLGIQAAEALEHAHQHGVVHRDIKPANLMLDATGNLWIADFGLARLETDAGMTMTGDLIGTLRYMSPEQALGQRGAIDHRTDIYSLGVTFYELLAHAPPFDGDDRAEMLRAIANDEPQRLRRRNRAVPAELETIIHKTLEKYPTDRYATAQELADDLRRFLDDKPIHAKPPSLVIRMRKWARRHKQVVALATAFAVLVMIGAGVAAGLFYQQRAEYTARQERLREAELTSQRGLQTLRRAMKLARLESNREAEFAFQEAIACLATLREQFPGDLEFAAEHLVARFHHRRYLLSTLGGEDEADEALRMLAAEFMRLDLSGDMRNTKATFFDLGRCGFQFGNRLAERGELATAASLFARARECFVRIAPDHQDAQARCLIEWGRCLDQQQQWEEARNIYRQALPLLDEWYSTFYTQPNAGAWQWTPYPDMFESGGMELNVVCGLQKVFVYQRLGEDNAAKRELDGVAEWVYLCLIDDRHEADLDDLVIEAAALLDVKEFLPSASHPRLKTTFASKLLRPATALLLRAGEAVQHDDPSSAEALFEQAIGAAQQANVDVRNHNGFRQMALRLGSSGVDRLQAYANWRDARRQLTQETDWLRRSIGESDGDPASIATRAYIYAFWLIGRGREQQARFAMETSIAHCRKAIVTAPKDHTLYVDLARSLTTSPVPELRDPHEAILLAEEALRIKADSSSALVALGAAYYRLGRWADAVNSFSRIPNRVLVHKQRQLRAMFLFDAMAHWQLGNHEQARDALKSTSQLFWIIPPPDFQLLRAEAEALMGVRPPDVMKPPRAPEP